ncbi:Zinc finger, C2H2-like [Phytophthora cactorum]|nr:Zinc finger, C2H2-like [Phytophthora cactorum]
MPASTTAIRPSNSMNQPRIRDSHQDRPFACPVPLCGGRFHRKFTLHEHLKTHTGEQPHQCPIQSCGKRFSTSGNLARHKRLHSLHKMECPVSGCTRIFTSKDMLAKHQKVQTATPSTPASSTAAHRSVPLPVNSRSSRQQQHRQHIQRLQQQQAAKVVSPIMTMHSPCDEFPVLDFDMMMFLPPVEEQLQHFSFLNTPTDPEALSDQELKDLLECLF